MGADQIVTLLSDYNDCFYRGDLEGLRDLYVDDDEAFVYFDNHTGCDSFSLDDHLVAVAGFVSSGEVVELMTEVLSASVVGDAGLLTARVRYSGSHDPPVRLSLFAERVGATWKVRHLHYSADPNR